MASNKKLAREFNKELHKAGIHEIAAKPGKERLSRKEPTPYLTAEVTLEGQKFRATIDEPRGRVTFYWIKLVGKSQTEAKAKIGEGRWGGTGTGFTDTDDDLRDDMLDALEKEIRAKEQAALDASYRNHGGEATDTTR